MYNLLLFDKCLQCYVFVCVFILLSHCAILSYCKYQLTAHCEFIHTVISNYFACSAIFNAIVFASVSTYRIYVSYIIVTCIYMCMIEQCLKNQVTVKYWPNTSAKCTIHVYFCNWFKKGSFYFWFVREFIFKYMKYKYMYTCYPLI